MFLHLRLRLQQLGRMARIKLKYVNAFVNRDRKNSRVRYYFRRRGSKAIPLPGLPIRQKPWRGRS